MLRIYNTLAGKKEVFHPIESGKVKIYVCGPTVYDACHIGHARSVIVFDVIVRYFRSQGYDVTYIRNFTDIDDKIINRANELGTSTKELSERNIQGFYDDMDALKVQRATVEPKATEYISKIIELIERLFEQELAYKAGGDVFYAVERFKDYGKLSGRKLEDMLAGARVEVDGRKRNPLDFVLWKGTKPGEPMWESPWGKGRPGWHIECSTMSTHFLGKNFDIHGGGKDLMFPHHENEIAQSEGAFGKPFANFWVHNGFVRINKEKMSKSLGNFLVIKDLVREYHPETIRLFLLSCHYRSPVDFTKDAMQEAEAGLDKIYASLERLTQFVGSHTIRSDAGVVGEFWTRFCEAMDDDFNTARAIGFMFDSVRQANRVLDNMGKSDSFQDKEMLYSLFADLMRAGKILGLGTEAPSEFFAQKKARSLGDEGVDETLIEKLVAERLQARKEKDWAKADQVRDRLTAMNIVLEDRSEGTVWKMKN